MLWRIVLPSTMWKRLCEAGLYARIVVKKKLVRKEDNVKKTRCTMTAEECIGINSFGQTNQSSKYFGHVAESMCCEKLVKKATTHFITPTVNHGWGYVIMAVVANCNVGDLHHVKGKLNQAGYLSIMQYHVIIYGTQLAGQGFVLIQDNAAKHASKLSQRYIKTNKNGTSWPMQLAN